MDPRHATPEARLDAAVATGRSGAIAEAEGAMRGVLADVRGQGSAVEARTLRLLTITLGMSGRVVEAWVLADAATRVARRAGDPEELIACLGALSGALYCLEETEALGEVLQEYEQTLKRHAADPGNPGWREYHEAAFAWSVQEGALDEAAWHLRAFADRLPPAEAQHPGDAFVLTMFRARLHHARGDVDGALAASAPLLDRDDLRVNMQVDLHVNRTTFLAAAGRIAEARGAGASALALLDDVADDPAMAFERVVRGRALAAALETVGDGPGAHRAYDHAAAAVLEHIAHLDACARTLPELGLDDGPQEAAVVRRRRAFVQDQGELLRRVAALLDEDRDGLLAAMADPDDGFLRICAWCERLKPPEGVWLPLGQFIPRGEGVRITHTICPACASTLR